MNGRRILVTGGAGFIGSHVCEELMRQGHHVRVLDNLDPQVHEDHRRGTWPGYLHRDVERLHGDVRNAETVRRALRGCDAVYHLAARVGVGQSMYQIRSYSAVNQTGTATLLECLSQRPVERLVVASSMSVYGEGRYMDSHGCVHDRVSRRDKALREHQWEPLDDDDHEPLHAVATPEDKTPDLSSIYALSKYDQERMCLITGQAYGMATVALRFFNVYGPRQALSNPYTGVMAIFASRLLNGRPPMVFEDGLQQRDFISVHDVARACRLALTSSPAAGQVFNIGSGQRYSIAFLARTLAKVMNCEHLAPQMTQTYRKGDIRHCFADTTLARNGLGFKAQVALETGMAELAQWLQGQTATDRMEQMNLELTRRGLAV